MKDKKLTLQKSNTLTQKSSSNSLSVYQNRFKNTIACKFQVQLNAKIKKLKDAGEDYNIDFSQLENRRITCSIKQIRQELNIQKGGKEYTHFVASISESKGKFVEQLLQYDANGNVLYHKNGDPALKIIYPFTSIETDGNDELVIALSPEYIEHLLVEKNFTNLDIQQYNKLNSKYSQRLYELFSSYRNYKIMYKKPIFFDIDELKIILLGKEISTKYNTFKKFHLKCLKNPINEINEKTDIFITYDFKKSGNKVKQIEFEVSNKNNDVIDAEVSILQNENIDTITKITLINNPDVKDVVKIDFDTAYDLIVNYSFHKNHKLAREVMNRIHHLLITDANIELRKFIKEKIQLKHIRYVCISLEKNYYNDISDPIAYIDRCIENSIQTYETFKNSSNDERLHDGENLDYYYFIGGMELMVKFYNDLKEMKQVANLGYQ